MLLPRIAEPIIVGETNPIRFEQFCLELIGRAEGIPLVPTSTTFDRGRDARSTRPSSGSHAEILCVTLNADIDSKVESDLARLSSTSTPDRVIYCASQKLSEHRIDQLTALIRKHVASGCSVTVLSAIQLAHLAESRFPEVLEKFYQGEIRTIQAAFLAEGQESAETRGLRLALFAFGSEDAQELRTEILSRAILDTLHRLGASQISGIASKLSADLGLPRPISVPFIASALSEMQTRNLTLETSGKWTLTENGKARAESIPPEAARDLLAGRNIIRNSLETLTGIHLTDAHFETVWTTLVDFLSDVLYSNGFSIIESVNNLLTGGQSASPSRSLDAMLGEVARRIKASFSGPELGEDFEQAILDIFNERSGLAFDWLARVCERFVALCALGLETTSSEEILNVIRRHRIVLDSDIVIRFLCQAEPDHSAVRDLLLRWRQVGGSVLLFSPVLEEVAHHAWISERVFKESKHLVGKVEKDELRRYVENAFVRTFFYLERDEKQAEKRWQFYIEQFRGFKPEDYSKILGLLQTDLQAEMLPCSYEPELQKRIADYMCKALAEAKGGIPEGVTKIESDKARRDGQILASIAAAREVQRQRSSESTITTLSSSSRLRKADNQFRATLGPPNAVMSRGALSYLIALLPDVTFGVGSLRRALFEFGETANLPDPERLALRVIKGTGEYNIPWARRRALSRHLEHTLLSEARKRDVPIAKIRKQFAKGERGVRPEEIIAKTLKDMAISDSKTAELREATSSNLRLAGRVKELERNLAQARRTQPKSNKRSKQPTRGTK